MSLERLIYNYLCHNNEKNYPTQAKDLSEIAEKELQDRIDCEKCNDLQDENIDLKELNEQLRLENQELKKQIIQFALHRKDIV
jgi:hypothetical protein